MDRVFPSSQTKTKNDKKTLLHRSQQVNYNVFIINLQTCKQTGSLITNQIYVSIKKLIVMCLSVAGLDKSNASLICSLI